jgi:hypothetical protein
MKRQHLACVALVSLVVSGCAGGETVSASALKAAKAKWEAAKVADYNLEWRSSGAREGRYRVFVRDGQVKAIYSVYKGKEIVAKPGQPRFYGVDGLFLVIEEDLAQLDTATPFGQPKGTSAVMRFQPDATYGYPKSYFRDVLGTPQGISIDVLKFEPKPADPAIPAPVASAS